MELSQAITIVVYIVLLGLALSFVWFLYRLMNADNPLEWWHFISTRGEDNQHYADLDKLGKFVALIAGTLILVWQGYAYEIKWELLLTYFTYAGAISGWAAYLRYKAKKSVNGNGSTTPAA